MSADLPLRRRDFLAGSALALGGLSATGNSLSGVQGSGERALLTVDDLLTPAGGTYVQWRITAASSPLLAHLQRTVPSFGQASSVAVGFVGQHVRSAPQYVEAAVVEFGDASASAIIDATAAWLAAVHGEGQLHVERLANGVQWTTRDEGTTDTLRIEEVGQRQLSFVSARGPERALLSPQQAVGRYATVVRDYN